MRENLIFAAMEYDYDKLREYIKRCRWQWATSMIEVPHEYIHRDKCALTREEFYYFVSAQRENGVHERWESTISPTSTSTAISTGRWATHLRPHGF